MKKRRKRKPRWFIEIKTQKRWKVVQLLKFDNDGKLVVRLEDGQVIKRKHKNVRFGVTKQINTKKSTGTKDKWTRKFRTKKKRNKLKRKGKKRTLTKTKSTTNVKENNKTLRLRRRIAEGLEKLKTNRL